MRPIKTVTIVGANGTMGRNIGAIFASFGKTKVYLVSRTLEKSIIAKENAYQSVRAESVKERMIPVDYSQLEECIQNSDLIFEACAEDWSIKESLHKAISDILVKLKTDKIICSGTSGLSITRLSELYEKPHQKQVIGMHFFNPPYQMTLCELIPTIYTDKTLFQDIFNYTKYTLLRTSIIVKDSPAFLGNRIGFYFINEAMQLAEKYKYNGGIDYIDTIFGAFTGRSMAPLATANFVGLDVHQAIVDNLYKNTADFSHHSFALPSYVVDLIHKGQLGKKVGAGLYRSLTHGSGAKIHQAYDIEHGHYRDTMRYTFPFVEEMTSYIKRGDYEEAYRVLYKNHSTEAELCLSGLLKYVLYSINAAKLVGDDIHAADDAMAAGFNWCPPLAMVEVMGGKEHFSALCKERIPKSWLPPEECEMLLTQIEKSKYDYRRFIKAKQ